MTEFRKRFSLVSLTAVFVSLFLGGCASNTAVSPETVVPLATIPVATIPDTPTATAVSATLSARVPSNSTSSSSVESEQSAALVTPTVVGAGIRPSQAEQFWVPDAGPSPQSDWRPPAVDVPLSLHPDDHYWLIRPLPSGSRNYELEWYPYGNDVLLPSLPSYRIHHGIDFPNETGTPIRAAGSGTVVHAGILPSPRNGVNYYGNTVVILHDWQWRGQDVYTLYAHTLELFVTVGEHVDQGQVIAGVGSSGEVSGPHLHLEVRVGANNYGSTRNPALWLAPFEGWGTLAGRFVDRRGRLIPGATILLQPIDVIYPIAPRQARTYQLSTVQSDDVWRENFVLGDLPAGRYTLQVGVNGVFYERQVTLAPERTHFEVIQADFEFVPTATPQPTATSVDTGGESSENNEGEETAVTPTP